MKNWKKVIRYEKYFYREFFGQYWVDLNHFKMRFPFKIWRWRGIIKRTLFIGNSNQICFFLFEVPKVLPCLWNFPGWLLETVQLRIWILYKKLWCHHQKSLFKPQNLFCKQIVLCDGKYHYKYSSRRM